MRDLQRRRERAQRIHGAGAVHVWGRVLDLVSFDVGKTAHVARVDQSQRVEEAHASPCGLHAGEREGVELDVALRAAVHAVRHVQDLGRGVAPRCDERNLSDATMGLLSSLPFACGIVACAGGGFFSDWIIRRTGNRKWGRRLSGSVGMLLGGLAWPFLNHAPNTLILGILVCVIFFLNDLSMGPAWASCADIGERYAGTIGGAMNMIGSLMGAMGNIVAGSLFGKEFIASRPWTSDGETYLLHGTDLVFLIYGASFLVAALCWQGVGVTRTLAGKADPASPQVALVGIVDAD